jgi:hypothetical protein
MDSGIIVPLSEGLTDVFHFMISYQFEFAIKPTPPSPLRAAGIIPYSIIPFPAPLKRGLSISNRGEPPEFLKSTNG